MTAIHIARSPPPLREKKRRGLRPVQSQPEDPPLFGQPPSSRDGKSRGGGGGRGTKHARAKKAAKTPPAKSATMRDYFTGIGI